MSSSLQEDSFRTQSESESRFYNRFSLLGEGIRHSEMFQFFFITFTFYILPNFTFYQTSLTCLLWETYWTIRDNELTLFKDLRSFIFWPPMELSMVIKLSLSEFCNQFNILCSAFWILHSDSGFTGLNVFLSVRLELLMSISEQTWNSIRILKQISNVRMVKKLETQN